jgi:hypothetical protein
MQEDLPRISRKATLYCVVEKRARSDASWWMTRTSDEPQLIGDIVVPGAIVFIVTEGKSPQGVNAPDARNVRRGGVGARWHLFNGKPPVVHNLGWSSYAASPRDEHRRRAAQEGHAVRPMS